MAKKVSLALMVCCVLLSSSQFALGKEAGAQEEGWISLFDGKTLNGWKASENKDTFTVQDGMIVAKGPRSHLFYVGMVENADFKNFEFKADVMTKPGSNSGIYFHTQYQDTDWPAKGYEVQVNNTHSDWRKTGGLYAVQDVRKSQAKDNEWFTEHIIVMENKIMVKVNGKTAVDWTEPEGWKPPDGMSGRKISNGTFALQGHDPGSIVYYKNIMVRPLPSSAGLPKGWINLFDGKTLSCWKASENKATFSVRDGMIIVDGPRSHLFYVGPVEDANFKNFEFKADIMTKPGSNSGLYFHSEYQETGWPSKGYEVQVNNTHSDWRKTGSLYGIKDVRQSLAKDNEWFTEHIIVQGKHITIKVNGKTAVDYTEPEEVAGRDTGRKISSGTFALQGHDPKSIIHYKNVMVKPLPSKPIKTAVVTGGHDYEEKPFNEMFDSFEGIKCSQVRLSDNSEIFEDISGWDYDVIVLYNMTQEISQKRQKNFIKLLNQGTGLVALHHMMASFQQWPEYRKIVGAKYYLEAAEEGGVKYQACTYKHDIDMNVHISDTSHPITRGMSGFTIHDEGYKYCGFEKDNKVLLTTDHPDSDKSITWVRQYGKARVCGIQLGHGSAAYKNPNYRRLVARAIKWSAGKLN